jgi:hypothetical protein
MSLFRAFAFLALLGTSAVVASAEELPPLLTASGTVDKADKESLSVKPRGPDGKFQKTLALKVTGTSKVAVLTSQKRGDKTILTQREIDAKDLVPGQAVAVIYSEAGKDGTVLLTAVAQPAPGK